MTEGRFVDGCGGRNFGTVSDVHLVGDHLILGLGQVVDFLLIGGGLASATAAETLRAAGAEIITYDHALTRPAMLIASTAVKSFHQSGSQPRSLRIAAPCRS